MSPKEVFHSTLACNRVVCKRHWIESLVESITKFLTAELSVNFVVDIINLMMLLNVLIFLSLFDKQSAVPCT